MFRWVRRSLVMVAAVAMGVAVSVPAQASTALTAVDGSGVLTNDFGEHADELKGSLCDGCSHSNNTDLVVMWQAILVAEGLLNKSGIDGQFGPNTTKATAVLQKKMQLAGDGMVGPKTWDKVDDRLRWVKVANVWTVRYVSYSGNGHVTFYRGAPGSSQGSGAYKLVSLNDDGTVTSFGGGAVIRLFTRTVTVK